MKNETINQKMVEKALAVDKDAIYYFHLIDIDSQFQTWTRRDTKREKH